MRKYQRLTIDEREHMVSFLSQGKSLRQIALYLNLNVRTISRELGHFGKTDTFYKAWLA